MGEIINLHSFLLEKCAPELLRLYREVELPLSRVLAKWNWRESKWRPGPWRTYPVSSESGWR